ncbi:hypothetical protein L6Q96_21640 [Candidatus Binatia bacterium]|nr:hypothetical protein [Candidatus Binatia bacterium]
MTLLDKAALLIRAGRWGLSMVWRNTHQPSPVPDNPRFKTPQAAVELIGDGNVVAASGLGGHQRASIVYWALRERFLATGRPRNLTVVNVGGHGGRGKAPGTIEEIGLAGLCARLITSHFETFHAQLDLAAAGRCELQCIPLGIMTQLFVALGRGRDWVITNVGTGTFIDPRSGRGTPVNGSREQLVGVDGSRLRYRMPPIDVAIFNAPAADRQGNIYIKHCAMIGESRELARAARRNGGRVIVNVGLIVDRGYDDVFLPARDVDAVVYYPDTEQTGGYFHRDPWRAITADADVPVSQGLAQAEFVNRVARITPQRAAIDNVVARLAAHTLAANTPRGGFVVIGTGHPEAVPRIVFERGKLDDVTFAVETGVIGGLPAPGIYFGSAFGPQAIGSSADFFRRVRRRLDATCLGVLQADSAGNVNVSRRDEGVYGYVGPGGFIDFTAAALTIVFVCAWTTRGQMTVTGDRVRLVQPGAPKFVEQVDEVTFNGAQALAAGKRVFYATGVGLFRLTTRGMELAGVFPGIDVERDILDVTPMRVVLPQTGRVPILPKALVTGRGMRLRWAER